MEVVVRPLVAVFVVAVALAVGCSEDSPTESENKPPGDTIRVPADFLTIQAAIDTASDNQTVLVAAGTYSGPGNRDLNFNGKAITLKSESGPSTTIIDCQDTGAVVHQGFYFSSRETSESTVDGFTIVNGNGPNGAGMGFRSCSPTIRNCVLAGNEASASGGAIHCKSASPTFVNCTFTGNSSPAGGAVFLIAGASPRFENCIISFSSDGEAVYCSYTDNQPTFICCDIYGNYGGDWIDCIETLADSNNNFSEDPLYCDPAQNDYYLQNPSPCAQLNSSCMEQVGALGIGCGQ